MQVLGYARTWTTFCFINGGCGEQVFAHTNGFGDFVLFDNLGWPWPIHDCYLDRFCQPSGTSSNRFEIRADAIAEYRKADEKIPQVVSRRTTRDIRRMVARDHLKEPEKIVFGYVQDYIENHAERLFRGVGTLGHKHLQATLANNRSQITIVTSEFESYTGYADLRNVVVRKKDMVAARLKAIKVLGIAGTDAVFICDEVLLVRGSPAK
ncbi:MAG TPA: hypothetical protein VNZ03_25915 [Terriglobales bacterium]|jgi:hypothetical protein|nr:hypothetical protein [Terriglobales bacterium]